MEFKRGSVVSRFGSGLLLAALAWGQAHAQAPAPSRPVQPPPAEQAAEDTDPRDDDDRIEEADAKQREAARAERRARLEALRLAARSITWEAPPGLKELFEKFVAPPESAGDGEVKAGTLRTFLREVNRKVPEIAASEGYFAPQVAVRVEGEGEARRLVVTVLPGPRVMVDKVILEFEGDAALPGEERAAQRASVESAWTLPAGKPFRQADWDDAKGRALEKLSERHYANATVADSAALVDVPSSTTTLKAILESGPRYTFGALHVAGLKRYPESLVRRFNRMKPGEPYELGKLLELQRALQNAPWFASAAVDIDRDSGKTDEVPIEVTIIERAPVDVGVALGYGTDSGARAELSYRNRNAFGRALDLQSAFAVDQVRQVGFADFYLPALSIGGPLGDRLDTRDSFGMLVESKSNQGLDTQRVAFAAYRQFKLRPVDNYRVGLSYTFERKMPDAAEDSIARALAPVAEATWRWVDEIIDPKKGGVLKVRLAAAGKGALSTQDFVQAYAHYQHWFPLGANDQVILRGEIGRTFAISREGIPEEFLFLAGGARSNRGYEYESLGARDGDAVVGGRYLLTASAEYVHWFGKMLGGALFYDVGDADDQKALSGNPSYGLGLRLRTPAGPLALDLAYAERQRKVRLVFSVSVAF
jgi:translocation and assembly module TamA